MFHGLGMRSLKSQNGWEITPPGFRFDIAIEEDLLEEIGRIVGYNNLPSSSLLMRSELVKPRKPVITGATARLLG
jgi:phenylalanyl-tRNA synthetase beta chain